MTNTTKNQLSIQLEKAIEVLKHVRHFYVCDNSCTDEASVKRLVDDMRPITEFCENFLREVPNLKEFDDLLEPSAKEYFEDLENWVVESRDPNITRMMPNRDPLISKKSLRDYSDTDLRKIFFVWDAARFLNPYNLYRRVRENGNEYYQFVLENDLNSWGERKRFLQDAKVFKRFTFA